MNKPSDQAAPFNWISIINDQGDLDQAFVALEGWNHFHTDTIRGRIRSLQLRPKEATEYYEKAKKNADSYGRTLRNLLRRFYLMAYLYENALIDESSPEGGDPAVSDQCLKELLECDLPESEIADHLRTYNRGLHYLNRERYEDARKVFRRILHQSRERTGDEKTDFYFGAAVAAKALGADAEADRDLENALLAIPALDNRFNMGHYAAKASALLRIWDREDDAREWDVFLGRLKIAPPTVELFRERCERILRKSAALQRVFLF